MSRNRFRSGRTYFEKRTFWRGRIMLGVTAWVGQFRDACKQEQAPRRPVQDPVQNRRHVEPLCPSQLITSRANRGMLRSSPRILRLPRTCAELIAVRSSADSRQPLPLPRQSAANGNVEKGFERPVHLQAGQDWRVSSRAFLCLSLSKRGDRLLIARKHANGSRIRLAA